MNAREKIQAQYAEDNARVPIAIKLCEKEIKGCELKLKDSRYNDFIVASFHEVYQSSLNSWTTHLDEFNEHKDVCQATNQVWGNVNENS